MAVEVEKSTAKWRKRGYYAEGTEAVVRLPSGQVRRKDFHGFVDRYYISADGARCLIQITSGSNVAARVKKILYGETGKGQYRVRIAELARRQILSGARILVEGWTLNEERWRYEDEEREITLNMLEEALSK